MKEFFSPEFRRKAGKMAKEFFLPSLNRWVLLRMFLVLINAFLLFKFILRPCFISGESMLPTYDRSGFVFCNLMRYWHDDPQRGDIVVISYFGRRYLLKRIIALEGDLVEFRDGTVWLNGEALHEPYVRFRGKWNTKPVQVAPGHCFVVGDNRGQSKGEHIFGEIRMERIVGGLLF